MKTVEKKVETFETSLVLVRELETVPMSDFLEAYPEMAKPIPEERLREILALSVGKQDLPKLWLLYRGYSYLEQKEHFARWQKEKEAIVWAIETIILRELKNPQNQNPEDAKLLYESSPHRSKTREQSEVFLKAELEKLFEEKASSVELKARRRFFPREFDQLVGRFKVFIRKAVVREMKLMKKPEKIFECIDNDDVEISEVDQVAVLNTVIDKSDDIVVIKEALKRIPNRYEVGPSVNKSILKKGWTKIIRLTNNREVLFSVEGEYAKAIEKLFGTLGPASLEELRRVNDTAVEHWESFQYRDESFKNILAMMETTYISILSKADQNVANDIMCSFKNAKSGTWKHRVYLQSIRRLYELSQSK